MSNKYDIREYALSKQVVKDLPKIIYVFKKLITFLEPFLKYKAVAVVHETVRDAKFALELQYDHYKKIKDNKAKDGK